MLLLIYSGSIITESNKSAWNSLSESFFRRKIRKRLSHRDFLPLFQIISWQII